MARVISRTFLRAALRTELWAGNRERWRHLLRPSHPIRWAWSTWDRRRRETEHELRIVLIAKNQVPELPHRETDEEERQNRNAKRIRRERLCGAHRVGPLHRGATAT